MGASSDFNIAPAVLLKATVEIKFSDEQVRKKALSSIEKDAELKPIFDPLREFVQVRTGTKDFFSKKAQLLDLVNSWNDGGISSPGNFEEESQSSSKSRCLIRDTFLNVILLFCF